MKTLKIIIPAFLLTAVAVWVGAHLYVSWNAAAWAQRANLSIGKISSNFLLGFTVDKATLSSPKKLNLTDIKISLRPSLLPLGTSLKFSANTDSLGKVSGTAIVFTTNPKPWNVTFACEDLRIENAIKLVAADNPKLQNITGSIVASGRAGGFLEREQKIDSWIVDLHAKSLKWRPEGVEKPVSIVGDVTIGPEKILIHEARVNKTLKLKGEVNTPWKNPSFDLGLRAKNADIESIAALFGSDAVPEMLKAKLTLNARVEGPATAPQANGTFSLNTQYAGVRIPDMAGSIHLENGKMEVLSDFSGGRIALYRSTDKKGAQRYSLSLEDIALASIAKENGWSNVKGSINSQMQIDTAEKGPALTGQFQVTQFRWGRFQTKPLIAGKIDINENTVRLTTQDKSLMLKTSINKGQAKLDEFLIDFGKNSQLSAHGKANFKDRSLDFEVEGKNVPPDLWPPLVARYPDITGAMDVQTTLNGTFDSPSAQGKLSFNELKFVKNGGSWTGSAKVAGSNERVSLTDIDIEGGYKGSLTWMPNKDRFFTADATMNDANPQLLADVMKLKESVAGELNGQVHLDVKSSGVVGSSTFSWVNGHYGDQNFDSLELLANLSSDKITIDQISLLRGSQAIRASGSASPMGNNQWKYQSALQIQHWGDTSLVVDGEATASGQFNFKNKSLVANIESPLLLLNDYAMENVTARIARENERLSATGRADPGLRFDVAMAGKDQKISGTINATSLRVEEFLVKMFPRKLERPSGSLSAQVKLSGTVKSPTIDARVDAPQIVWRNETFATTADVAVRASTVSISKANVRLAKGGILSVSGKIIRGESNQINISGKGRELNIQSLFNLMDKPLRVKGTAKVDFEMQDGPTGRNSKVVFSGNHEGIGPFAGAGTISGAVTQVNDEWNLSGIKVTSAEGYATLVPDSRIYFDRDGAGTMRLVAETRNLRAGLITLFGEVEMAGSWKGKSTWADQKDIPIELDVFARSLWVNQHVLDGNITHLTLKRGEVEFSPIFGSGQKIAGKLVYTDYPTIKVEKFRITDKGTERLYMDGYIGPDKWDYVLNLKEADAAILSGLLDTTIAIDGAMDLKVKGMGSLKTPELTAEVLWQNGHVDVIPLDTAECKFSYKDGVVQITDLRAIKKKGYQLTGKLRFNVLDDEQEDANSTEMDIVIEKGDMAFLREIIPEVHKAKGSFSGRMRMAQKSWGTSVSGFLTAQKIQINSEYTPDLKKGELKVRLDKNRLHIEEASAQMGEGVLKLNGYVDFVDGRPSLYNLSMRTEKERGISVRIPQLYITPGPILGKLGFFKSKLAGVTRGEPLINLIFKGPADRPLLAGTIELVNTVFTYPPPKAEKTTTVRSTAFTRWFRTFLDAVQWDVSLVAGARTWYQNELVDANVTGQLQFAGPTNDLNVDGRILTEQGSIVYSGSEFKIKNAVLEIETKTPALNDVDVKKTLVYLKANAEKEVYYTDALSNSNQDTIVMSVPRALLGEIEPRFYSKNNPNLSTERAFQLAMGLPLSESVDTNNLLPDQRERQNANTAEGNEKFLRLGLVQLLDASLASPLARALARNTGLVDYIRVTFQEQDHLSNDVGPGELEAQSSNITQNEFMRYAKGTKVKFGRGISNRLFADYSFRVDEYQNKLDLRHEVDLSYRVSRNFFLKGITELDSERTLGRPPDRRALLENQWRFGLPRKKKKPLKETKLSPSHPARTASKPT